MKDSSLRPLDNVGEPWLPHEPPPLMGREGCKSMNAKYPHGVGKTGARDKTKSGDPVTNFLRNGAINKANKARDRDGDGVACEKQ